MQERCFLASPWYLGQFGVVLYSADWLCLASHSKTFISACLAEAVTLRLATGNRHVSYQSRT